MMEKVLLVKDVLKYFKYRQICGNEESLNRKIEVADINRPGLELSGYFEYSQPRRVIILGGKEPETFVLRIGVDSGIGDLVPLQHFRMKVKKEVIRTPGAGSTESKLIDLSIIAAMRKNSVRLGRGRGDIGI